MNSAVTTNFVDDLTTVDPAEWNALNGGIDNPFLRHEFLAGLEVHGCVGEKWGWLPRHLLLRRAGRLIGALPLYLKYNSYGELVFDWSWADAYQRSGLSYYPKAVSAIPYSPVTSSRLLVADGEDRDAVGRLLIHSALEFSRERQLSSLHILFPLENEVALLEGEGLMRRTGSQFHWFNHGYADFDAFLATFSAQKRKKLKRERKRVDEQGIRIEILDGHQATADHWQTFHRFYRSTFQRRSGWATLSEPFFLHLAASLPDSIMLALASIDGRYVAGALSLRSADTLYGRHWGCDEEYHSLHFELCYYQGIDYCIRHGLKCFEPGAQGEHKVSRGFEPRPTWSAHWLAHPVFARAVGDYLQQEQAAMEEYMDELAEHLPYKQPTT